MVLAIGTVFVLMTGKTTSVPENASDEAIKPTRLFIQADEIADELEIGDLVLIGGHALWFQAGVGLSETRPAYGHVGIVTATAPDILVLEASGSPFDNGKIAESELSHFLREAEWLSIVRPLRDADHLVSHAKAAAETAKGFDSEFDLTERDALYCTELIDVAMREAGVFTPLARRSVLDREVILPEAIRFHPDFRVIAELP